MCWAFRRRNGSTSCLRFTRTSSSTVATPTIHITTSTLGIKEQDLTILHANHEIYIEEGFVPLLILVTDGIMLPAGITILIPPVNILLVGFQESFETLFRLRVFEGTDANNIDKSILYGMKDEMKREMDSLTIAGSPRPFYMSYLATRFKTINMFSQRRQWFT